MNSITFVDAIAIGFKKYATFSGVASRSEYWYWTLFVFLLRLVLSVVDVRLTGGVILNFVGGALVIPSLAVTVRRFRDAGFSAWFLALWAVPLGALVAFLIQFIPDFERSLGTLSDSELQSALVQFQTDSTGPIATAINSGVFDNALVPALVMLLSLALVGLFDFIVTVLPSKVSRAKKGSPEGTDFQVKL